jgi:hypothetical protein
MPIKDIPKATATNRNLFIAVSSPAQDFIPDAARQRENI